MTTAHRPTYHPAVGSANSGGFRFHAPRLLIHSRDLAAHTQLKVRKVGQSSQAELQQRDLKQELIDRENLHKRGVERERRRLEGRGDEDEEDERKDKTPQLLLTSEEKKSEEEEEEDGKLKVEATPLDLNAIDFCQFDDDDAVLSDHNNDDEDEDDDGDDEEAELQRELEKIRAEREAERKKREEEEAAAAAAENKVLHSNPLLNEARFGVKRRWDDDVVFKGQTRGEDVTEKVPKRFINDSVRSDFHRNFMKRYIR